MQMLALTSCGNMWYKCPVFDVADRYEDGSDEYLPGVSSESSSGEEEPYVRDCNNLVYY